MMLANNKIHNLKKENLMDIKQQYTVRIYDYSQVNKLENLYKKVSSAFRHKSDFLSDCLIRGLEVVERDLLGVHNIETLNELYDEIRTTVNRLNTLIEMSERNSKESFAQMQINRKLLSSNYNMLLGISESKPKNVKCVEAGMYEELPERLEEILENILTVVLKEEKKCQKKHQM